MIINSSASQFPILSCSSLATINRNELLLFYCTLYTTTYLQVSLPSQSDRSLLLPLLYPTYLQVSLSSVHQHLLCYILPNP